MQLTPLAQDGMGEAQGDGFAPSTSTLEQSQVGVAMRTIYTSHLRRFHSPHDLICLQ